jgi:HK97 family phage portal protein
MRGLSGILSWAFKSQLNQFKSDIIKAIGSDMYQAMLRNVQNQPVYMEDNIETYVKEGYLFNPTVYSIVSFICQKAGSIPWGVYEVKDEKALSLYKSASPKLEHYKKEAVKTKALVELPDHDLNALFENPNPLQSWTEFIEQVVGFKLITGNTYIHAIGPKNGVNAGLVKEMWVVPSQIVSIVAGDKMQPVKAFEIKGDRSVVLDPREVIHLKYWSPNYSQGTWLYGVSPIQAARRVVTKSNSSYDASVGSFQNMGAQGILTPEPTVGQAELTEEQQEMLEQRFKKKTGPKNAGRPLISGIPLKWQQTGMSPVDLNIIESDRMDLRTLCNIYHVPSELFNDAANKTYSNTKEAGTAVYTNAVIPEINLIRNALNNRINSSIGDKIFIDYDTSMISELQDDLAMMTTALAGAWWLTVNERRDIMNFPVRENEPMSDQLLIPAGLLPMNVDVEDAALDDAAKALNIKDYES